MMRTRCPTCGSVVRVHTAGEGTSSYEPLSEELNKAYPEELFTPLSDGEMETIRTALQGSGVRAASDRLHASWARHWGSLLARD